MSDLPTPRINSSLLQRNVGKTVRLVGRITTINPTQAILEASDRGQVNVFLANNSPLQQGVAEIVGQVNPDLSVIELTSCMFKDDFDPETYDKMIRLAHDHPTLFGWN